MARQKSFKTKDLAVPAEEGKAEDVINSSAESALAPAEEVESEAAESSESVLKETAQVVSTVAPKETLQGAPAAQKKEAVEAKPALPCYRVKERAVVSLFGQICTLEEGTVVDAQGYGLQGLQRLKESGVKLEEIE